MQTPSSTLVDLETKFWQSMVDHDTDVPLNLLGEPALMVSSHGAMKFDHVGYRKMADQGTMEVRSFESSDMQVVFPNDATAILSYRVKQGVAVRGKGATTQQEMNDTSTWVRTDHGWRCAMHTETPIEARKTELRRRNEMASKNTICLWYDGDAEAAANFYANTFPESAVGAVQRAPGDYPDGKQGGVITVEFTVAGVPCIGLNGGPHFKHSEAFSFQIATDDQAETDRLWAAIVGNGGQESQCGWCKDRWGLSWQITPRALMAAISDSDPAAAKRAFEAMMTMGKIDIAAIEAARRG